MLGAVTSVASRLNSGCREQCRLALIGARLLPVADCSYPEDISMHVARRAGNRDTCLTQRNLLHMACGHRLLQPLWLLRSSVGSSNVNFAVI